MIRFTLSKSYSLLLVCIFTSLSIKVVAPVLLNKENHRQWPHVMSQDVMRHIHALKSSVFVMSGQVKGRTLLPLPAGSEKIEQAAFERETRCKHLLYFLFPHSFPQLSLGCFFFFYLTVQCSFMLNFLISFLRVLPAVHC